MVGPVMVFGLHVFISFFPLSATWRDHEAFFWVFPKIRGCPPKSMEF